MVIMFWMYRCFLYTDNSRLIIFCPFLQLTTEVNSSGIAVQPIQPSLPVQILQIVLAMLVMDTWQYFVHRYMHQNKFLYRHIHSQHHRLVVPYAIGALYNHPLEGLLLDTLGGAISFLVAGMTARTAVIFFCFAVIKTVDDHCGLWLPGNIFHLFFQNNTAYHDIHHQLQGTKYNYSQPFFPLWDKLLGTHMPYTLVKRPEGGFEARLLKDWPFLSLLFQLVISRHIFQLRLCYLWRSQIYRSYLYHSFLVALPPLLYSLVFWCHSPAEICNLHLGLIYRSLSVFVIFSTS